MKVDSLRVLNFMSIGDIKLSLNRPGLNLVLGKNLDDKRFDSNGSAKSALFEAMTWGLYGKFLRDIPVDEVVRTGEKELKVRVTVDPEDGTGLVSITRSRKNKTSEVTVLNAQGTPLFPSDSVKDIQQYIDNWLGMDFRTFTNSVYFGKGLAKFFMSSSDTDRKELLDTILQMLSFDKALSLSKSTLKDLEEQTEKTTTSLAVNTSLLEEKKTLLEKEQEYLTVSEGMVNKLPIMEEEHSLLVSSVEDKKTNKILLKTLLEKLEKDRSDNISANHSAFLSETRRINSSSPIKTAEIERAFRIKVNEEETQRDEQLSILDKALQEANAKLLIHNADFTELQKQTHTLKSQWSNLDKQCKSFSLIEADVPCTHCFKIVDKDHRDTVISDLQHQMTSINGTLASLATEENKVLEQIRLSNSFIDLTKKSKTRLMIECQDKVEILEKTKQIELRDLARNIAHELSKIEKDYHEKTHPIVQEFSEKKVELDIELSKLENEILSLSLQAGVSKRALDSITEGHKRRQEAVGAVENAVNSLLLKRVELEGIIASLEKETTRVNFWVEAFGAQGIKSFVFENALPYITERANFYSTSLTGGTVVIDISPTTKYKTKAGFQEKLNVSAINKHGANIYPGNSDGERRRIDICILLALQDLIATRASKFWNTVIFDEVMDALDRTGIEHVIELFRTFADKSIFIISHSEDIKKYFDTAVMVEKSGGISSLKEL